METVVIAMPALHETTFMRRLGARGAIAGAVPGAFSVSIGPSTVYVRRDDAVSAELGPKRLARLVASLQNPIFFTADFSDIVACRQLLESVADDPELRVSNDHGVIVSGSDFVRLLRERPGWDWRTDDDWPRDDPEWDADSA
jgi:hypothetical protein